MEIDLSRKLEQLHAICRESGVPLIRARINGLLGNYHLELDEDDFMSLLSQEQPSAVFYEIVDYEPDIFVRDVMRAHGWKESLESSHYVIWLTLDEIKAELATELAQSSGHIGLPRSLMTTYTVQGVHRLYWITAEWAEDLWEKIGEIVQLRDVRADEAELNAAKALDGMIDEVAADPEFRAIRGRPKRLLYVQKKYGDKIPPHPRGRVSRPAQNCNLVDENLSIVLIKADEKAWSEDNLS